MKYLNDITPLHGETQKGEIHIRVWEVFLEHNKNNLASTLEMYSLCSPLHDLSYEGTITYHFTPFDWSRTLKSLLERSNVPYIEGEVAAEALAH
jgi:hypothetical protein